MKTFASWVAAAVAGVTFISGPSLAQDAPASSLSELLQRIQSDTSDTRAEAQRREAEFRQARDRQAALLADAEARLAALVAEGERLTAEFDANDLRIIELQDQLTEKQGEFGELFGVARQAAGDVKGLLDNSIISAEFDNRTDILARVSETQKLPTRDELDEIWKRQLEEMIAQREVKTFTARVGNFESDGTAADAEVTRIGVFTLFARDGGSARVVKYEDSAITMLPRQPSGRILGAANDVARSGSDRLVAGPIDPARGELLEIVVDSPTLGERINQGGTVGYVIIGLAIIGVLFGLLRTVQLFLVGSAVNSQAKKSTPSGKNPLANVMRAAEEAQNKDTDSFQLKIDEAIIKESSGLDFGLNFLKLAAAIAPLLGLLGTVTGMIITFQQITLFGTGDPKIMAGGISQALITTVLGLVAAIPLLLIHSFAASASRGVQQVMEEQSTGIIARHAERSRSSVA